MGKTANMGGCIACAKVAMLGQKLTSSRQFKDNHRPHFITAAA